VPEQQLTEAQGRNAALRAALEDVHLMNLKMRNLLASAKNRLACDPESLRNRDMRVEIEDMLENEFVLDETRVYLTNAIVHQAMDSGASLEDCLVALAAGYDAQQKELCKLLGEGPSPIVLSPAPSRLAKLEAVAAALVALPQGLFEGANRYDCDDCHKVHLWANGISYDLEVPK
jgi:hypothetical protein